MSCAGISQDSSLVDINTPTMDTHSRLADLSAPFEQDIILEVRSSRMKTMPGLTIQSGIDKQIRTGRVPVSALGLEEDEHDPVFHGGIDKAVHGCRWT